MLIKDLYYEFSLLINKNSERKNVDYGIDNFALIYNRESKRWLAEFIERNQSTDNINTVKELLITDYQLFKKETNISFDLYEYPVDYFIILQNSSYSKVKSNCGEGVVYNYLKKPNELNVHLEDKFTKPSFQWERGLGDLYSEGIKIFKNEFDILNTYITYYKIPKEIFPEGFKTPSGIAKYNEDPLLSDYLLGQILDRIVSEVSRQFNLDYNTAETRKQITI